MFSAHTYQKIAITIGLLGLILSMSSARNSAAAKQDQSTYFRLVRKIETDRLGVPRPVGLAYSSVANTFLMQLAPGAAQPAAGADTFFMLTPLEDLAGSVRVATAIADPLNMAFDRKANRLLFLDVAAGQLGEIKSHPAGGLDSSAAANARHAAREFGVQNPRGMSLDPASGRLFILDNGLRIVQIDPGPGDSFDGAAARQAGRISEVNLRSAGLNNPRGIAFNPANRHLYLLSPAKQLLYELTEDGALVATRDLSSATLRDPNGMVFAPSGDSTDDPAQLSLYIADSGLSASDPGHGKIVELSLTQAAQVDAAAITEIGTLIRTINTSQWSPPSPDSMGLGYIASSGRLLESDSEVEEMSIFTGKNLFQATLAGSLQSTGSTIGFSNEPTGVAYNSTNGHVFISDDDADEIFEIAAGSDGQYFTSDDTRTSFDTRVINNMDAEGVAFDSTRGHLYIADGLNSEVYRIMPGANGVFNGIAPAGDDQATHFNTSSYVSDPEGIEYDPATDHLYITDSAEKVAEITLSGTLIRLIDITAFSKTPSGLAIAPSSANAAVMSLYVADRGVDNDSHPTENDGKIYEVALGSSPPSTTNTPTRTPTTTPTPSTPNTPTSTPTTTPTPIPGTSTSTPTPNSADLIFADGFESGNLSAWSLTRIDSGDLSVSAAAALGGTQGMQTLLDDTTSIYVVDERPNAEPRYRARFYLDPNAVAMTSGETYSILYGYTSASDTVLHIELRFSSGAYQIRASLKNDSGTWIRSSWLSISDAAHSIEVDWRAASAAGANNGGLALWFDGVQNTNLTAVDNDTWRIDFIRLGAVSGVDTGTRGTVYFDTFESRRQSYIGP